MSDVRIFDWIEDDKLQPAGEQVFAIGDVHGHKKAFESLLDAMGAAADPDSHLVLLGDMIDRGSDPMGVLRLAAKDGSFKKRTRLMGNHDLFLHGAIAGNASVFEHWLLCGGMATLEVMDPEFEMRKPEVELRPFLIKHLGKEVFESYENSISHIEIGNLLLIHAGIHPNVPFERHFNGDKRDASYFYEENCPWAWVREPFLLHDREFEGGRFVVHGHSPESWVLAKKGMERTEQVHLIDGWRLGLDGTHRTQRTVSGAQIEDGRYRIFMANIDG